MRFLMLVTTILLITSGCNKKGVGEEVAEHTAEVAGDIVMGDIGEAAKDIIQGAEDIMIDISDGDAKAEVPTKKATVTATMSLPATTQIQGDAMVGGDKKKK